MMEDEERQRKLQAGKAKLAEYRQRKAQSDGQKKQKKKKKQPEAEEQGEEQRGDQNTVFSLSKTLRSGESVTHDQTYTIEPESEVSTTAEDCSSEVNGFHERTSSVMAEEDLQPSEALGEPQSRIQIMEDELAAKNMAVEELSRELEEIRAAFGAEGVQQLQDFEEALKQRDEIITQLTANLQQARTEKEEVMREFLELTEQSQKLQIQFQQLQAGEILRSSNISSTAADLLQARQQITLYQQQLDDRDAQVRGRQEKTQEQLLLIAQLQEKLSEAERVRTQTEESFSQRLREKDLLNTEHQSLTAQLQDQLLTSKQQAAEINKHLSAKTQELDHCEKELSASRQKERMSSGEILQLMKTVEDLQRRCHQGGQSESEALRRVEDDWSRRMEQLRAELDEMYGQQIVQMKQELRTQHAAEVERIRAQHGSETEKIVQQHQSELERFKGQLFQSAGGVNVLNVKVIELQQKLQETQVLREKAEQELTQTSTEKLGLAQEVERLRDQLKKTEIHSPEKMQHAISELQAQLDLAREANGELEAKHESEITNYKIKLEMLEREKDAVLDRMAESQESELERLRTQLLFSHEEELSRLRDDLQRESQLNVENLRDEMGVRHREALRDFEDKLRSVESERATFASERLALLEEIVALKNEAGRATESEELVAQLKELQAEVECLRAEHEEKTPTERDNLLQEIDRLSSENEELGVRLKDLQDEIEKQRNTFSFAEKNFEVNYQELKDEYTCLVNAKLELEERLIRDAAEYQTKLGDLQTRREEVDGKTPVEKDAAELMEKLETAENEKKSLTERLSLREEDVKRLEEELKRTLIEKDASELMEKLETAENENRKLVERLSLMETDAEQLKDELKKIEVEKDTTELMEKLDISENENRNLVERLSLMEIEVKRLEEELKKTPIEKDSTELMGKLEMAENEKKSLIEQLSLMQADVIRLEEELKMTLIEKDSSELMEKLETAENEKKSLTERLSLMETDMKHLEEELKKTANEKDTTALMEKLEMAENENRNLVERLLLTETDLKLLQEELKTTPIEKDSSELMEKLKMAEIENRKLVDRLSLMETDAEHLEDELKKTEVEKDTTELMEKLEMAENKNRNLVESLSLIQIEVKRLEEELKKTPIEKDASELMEKLETAENEKKSLTERLSLMETDMKRLEEELKKTATEKDTTALMEKLEMAENKNGKLAERLSLMETDVKRLEEELKDALIGKDSSELGCGGLSSEEKHHAHISSSREALGSSPSSPAAERARAHTLTHTAAREEQLSASDRLPSQVETGDAQADGDAVQTLLMMQPPEMEGSEHEECRLRLEAQRISLSQIHAAQLELLRESLSAQTQTQEMSGASGQPTGMEEMERLKNFYQQQMEETQERFTAEILLLQRRVQELSAAGDVFSMPSVCPPLMTSVERREHLQDEDEDEEERLRASSPEEAQLRDRQEEIAKVIVQMSVEFAQQTEQARISREARETSTGVQTDRSEDEERPPMKSPEHRPQEEEEFRGEREVTSETLSGDDEEEEHVEIPADDDDGDGEEALSSEALRSSHTLQLEAYQEQNTLLTAQIHTLSQQLLQTELELQQMKEREDEMERRRDEQLFPSMHSSSTQTEQTTEEEEEEGRGRAVTSDPELSSDVITAERDDLRQMNSRLRLVLMEVLKTTAAAEETIGRHVEGILEASSKTDVSSETFFSAETGADDGSLFSAGAGEGRELAVQGAEPLPEGEELLMSLSTRLQSAVEKLLIAITETGSQLEHARITQTELMREKFRHNEEMEELLRRQEELQERLGEEERAREQLALELHRAEGVIDGYTGERLALEQQVRERTELQLTLEQELCVTASRLRELELERQQIQNERQLLSRQQDAMREGAGPRELRLVEAALDAAPEADLLEETEKLMAEKVEVQRQAEKESGELLQQVKQLEAELEEQVSRLQELQETHGTETADLRQQIQALEKQMEKNRKFMDEQAADREHERDVFQQEIHNLEQQLKNPAKTQTGSDRRDREVQELSAALQEKADWCSELLLSSEQLQRDVCERDEEIETLGARLRELEHTLMHQVEEVQHVSMAGRADVTLEAQLQTEREALDRKEKEIVNLEEQLEQFREELENKSEEVNQLHMQLEIQRKEISSHQQDLQAQAQLAQVLEEKDRQIAVLHEQLAKRQRTGTEPENEAAQLKDELVAELQAQVECLRSEQQRLKRDGEEEVEQLGSVIEKLQHELTLIERTQGPDEYDEMRQRMEEALRDKTASLVVLQAQVQALEESAGSKVTSLSRRVEELETSVEEKDSELRACRLKVERAQTDAGALYEKVSQLEEKLREKVAAVLVSQAQLEAIQTQTKELRAEARAGEAIGPSAQLRSEGLTAQDGTSTGGTGLLAEKLKELEEGLSGMQKDQELQKQLLSSSEEEVMEYERRLAVMIDLLNQMRTRPSRSWLPAAEGSGEGGQALSELLPEVRGQAASTEEELSRTLQEEIRVSPSSREEDAAETTRLLAELQEVRGHASGTLQELESCRGQRVRLEELLQEREMSIALLKDQLHRASQEDDRSTTELLQELQEVKGEAAVSREELRSLRERGLKLQEEIQVRDASIAELKDKVRELQTALTRSSEEEEEEEEEARRRGDAGEHHGPDRSTELQEMMAEYEEKIAQMQELHAAEILDMEARHISESESLRRETQQLEDECVALRDAVHTLRTAQVTEAASVRSERPAVSPFKDGYTSDSGSDWSQRVASDAPHLQQENRSTPEGARRDPEPDVLPDRIKSLLREVHQEGMQVLSLSELPLTEGAPQSWSRERDAFINTLESLTLLISRLQTHTQVDGDWRAELLSGVQRVFVQERDALKNILYSHLERLDTADAVIHLNQLERALAEQDARQRELMGALFSADRHSLLSEIQQLRDQLQELTAGTERERPEEMKTELKQTKLELECALQTQHKHLKELDALRTEVSLKAAEVDSLNDRLSQEQKKARELQWAFEKERCRSDRKQEAEREEVEDLKLSLEELSSALEKERQTSARLRDVSDSSELQVQLEAQRARSEELSGALEKQKELNTQLLKRWQTHTQPETPHTLLQAEATCSQVEAGVLSVESLLQTLQAQLDEKQAQVVQLMEQLETRKLEALQNKRQWDEERSVLAQDQSVLRATRDGLQRRASELQTELERERDGVRRLERDRDGLQEALRRLEDNHQSARSEDRTRDWVLQTGDVSLRQGQRSDPKHMESILSRLQLIAAKINSLTGEGPDRVSVEAPDRDSLAWLHSNVQDVMSLLQHIPSAPSALPESAALLTGGSSSLLNERLLRQNAELTGFVSRLTEEKNDLRNQLLKLEDELRRYRQKKTTSESSWIRSGPERQELLLFSSERDSWAQERNRLEKSVRQAEAELTRLRAEIRSETLRDLTGADLDNTALRRMYGKYLRAESFRKALIYQKKYLLLLLGGFQECEEATLSLIARMGGFPTHTCLESVSRQRRGLTRFRSAARVAIALSRMRFLVKRWQRAAGGSVTSPTLNRNGLAQITGSDVRNESSYLHPGAVEVFRERRAASRGRTGRDSPRSAASLQHRYTDTHTHTVTHLQNYDPDRALTDYISRLEALQRRLGSVQSGSSSYAQLHFGVRR
ncbi:A-kinase anchor protein 9 [Puntigrus tetrazona]|uniref:A-kinase anchor protein 9 n=1 Tax=Puntigrus tetrazona TaxID=1606681 RepID=UPI001C8ADB4F|nr:A-kinase anchor protein 9 [Puntigrus tetrazona]